MADMKTIADLLVLTNKNLDKLTKDNEKNKTTTAIIKQNLPEILNAQALAGRKERFGPDSFAVRRR